VPQSRPSPSTPALALVLPPYDHHVGTQLFSLLYLLTIFVPLFKNGWWYVFTQVDMSLAYALTSAIGIVVIPEITVPGFEGVIYGAVTTYTNQARK